MFGEIFSFSHFTKSWWARIFPRATLITLIASIKAFALLLFSKSYFHFLHHRENNLLIYLLLTQKSHSALLRRRFHLTSNSSQQMICRWFSCSSKTQDPGGINWLFCSIFLMLSVWKKKIKHVGSEGLCLMKILLLVALISIDLEWSGTNVKEWHCDALLELKLWPMETTTMSNSLFVPQWAVTL